MTTTTAKLLCPECRRENEPERIYCHDCGARLNRVGLTKAKAKEEDLEETQRRVKAMFDPRRALLRRRFFQGCKLILAALLIAGLVQMLRPPDLPPKPKEAEMPEQINLALENAAMDPRIAPPHYTQDQINSYLVYTLKGKQAALSKYLKFEGASVVFNEGTFRFFVGRSLFGYTLFSSGTYAASIENGQVKLKNRAGYLGRLPIHPALMQYADILFADVRGALERERKSVVKLGGVELHPQTLALLPRVPQT